MKLKKEKTTILFVNKQQQSIKPIQVSSSLILNWKKYLFTISLFFVALLGIIGLLAANHIKQSEQQNALIKKLSEMHVAVQEVDTTAVKRRFIKIDEELNTINQYLKARGIQPSFKGPKGGPTDNDIISTEEISTFYESYLNRVIYNFSYTPLGIPCSGNITSSFGHRENPFGGSAVETHKGLDINGPMGAQVKAMAKGVVEFTGIKGGYGNCIILKHGNGFKTLYGHLSKIVVRTGQQIDIGQQIGNVGSTGRSTGPHLHYEVHKNGQRINPENFLTLN